MHPTKLNRSLLLSFSITLIATQHAAAQAGSLDPTFGNGGIVTTDFGDQSQTNNMATANAVTIQSNGQIVVGGGIPGSTGFPSPAVARYNTNGSLDTTFGTNGITSIPSIEDVPFMAIALQSDGKIVAVGESFVARFLSTGVLDSTFGTGGIASLGTDFIGTSPQGVAIQPDGSILVADRYLLRLLSNGQFDTSFGNGGTARTAGYPASGLALLPSGKILVASSFSGSSGFISQYDSNGALDTTFGIGGQLASPGTAAGLALLASGEFLAGGSLINNSTLPVGGAASSGFAVSRYLATGVADTTFGTNGGTFTVVPVYQGIATSSLALQPSGDIVTLGTAQHSVQTAFSLARYTPTGQLDTTFGNNGTVVTTFGGGIQTPSIGANALAIQSDGKIVAAGNYSVFVPYHGIDTAFKIIRYLSQ
jgi:uncharacterized delta-60 repeat protein